MKKTESQEILDTTINHVLTVEDLVVKTNSQLDDALYIANNVFIPEKKDIRRCYRTDFQLKTKGEAEQIVKEKKILISPTYKDADFFVYNERTEELVPFKKNDYLMDDQGYFTYDGKNYISYDNNGGEIGRFSYIEDKKLAA